MTEIARAIDALVSKHGSLRAAARVLQCDAGYLSRLRTGEKDNPDSALLRKLGLRRIVQFAKLKEPRT